MLLGRANEQSRIEALLAAARRGSGAALVLSGEAGAGKSSLLEEAAAQGRDFRILRAVGVPSEAGVPFAGLHALLWPVAGRLDAIAPGQASAVRSALGLEPGRAGDRLVLGGAVLSLLAAAASESPLLCLVDDAHWLDEESREVLLFAARRLHSDAAVMLFAVRIGEGRFPSPGLPELPVQGLEPAAGTELLRQAAGRDIARGVAERLVVAVRGNPLALMELGPSLTPGQLDGREPLDEPIRANSRVQQAYGRRIASLSEEARWRLLLAAASDTPALAVVIRAAGGSLVGVAEAEASGLARREGGDLRFRHPLVRSAVYHGASEEQRRAAHMALAEAFELENDDRGAWHRALAATAPDEELARMLEEVAERAGRRGGMAARARALARAAQLTQDTGRRATRLLQASAAAYGAAELGQAEALCRQALAIAEDPGLRADLHMQLTWIVYRGSTAADWRPLVAEADRLSLDDPPRAAELLATACRIQLEELDPDTSSALAERAWELGGPPEGPSLLILSVNAWARLLKGRRAEAERLARLGSQLALEKTDVRAPLLATVLFFAERYDEAEEVLVRSAEQHRQLGASMPWGLAVTVHAFVELRRARFTRAYALGTEALQLVGERGTDGGLRLACLAEIDAVLGRLEEARSHAAHALERGRESGSNMVLAWAHAALGLLELGQGHFSEAIEPLTLAEQLAGRVRDPTFLTFRGDLVEALARSGYSEEAATRLTRLELEAEAVGSAWGRAVAGRCRALLAPEDECDLLFREALQLCVENVSAFELARTELVYGERLRRLGQRRAARQHLRAAATRFDLLSASPWGERARRELRGSGETLRPQGPSAMERLTPQEIQVSLLAIDGATNQEIAGRLFVSPRTVESHLGSVYRKLGLRSRAQLAAHFRDQRTALLC